MRVTRFFAALMIGLAVLSSISFGYSGGNGSVSNPYQIASKEDLLTLAATTMDYNKCFILTADIDLTGKIFTQAVIAPDINSSTSSFEGTGFNGVFDGNGHVILNLNIKGIASFYTGLFGYVNQNGKIKNLYIKNIVLQGYDYAGGLAGYNSGTITYSHITGSVNGQTCAGGLIGYSWNGTISNCSSKCNVKGTNNVGGLVGENHSDIQYCFTEVNVSGLTYVGGLAGFNVASQIINSSFSGIVQGNDYIGGLCGCNDKIIDNCYSVGTVSGSSYVGGLAGYNEGNIYNSFSTGNVQGSYRYIGGLVGYNYYSNILDSYALNSVSGKQYVGGLIGYSGNSYGISVERCFSAGLVIGQGSYIGGLIGLNEKGNIIDCFWDMQTSAKTDSSGGSGKTTTQMMAEETFANWACSKNWTIDIAVDYPHLKWENASGNLIGSNIFAGGSGSQEDPYLVATAEHLKIIGSFECLLGLNYKLISDIDLSGYDGLEGRPAYTPIGNKPVGWTYYLNFCGTFDGNNHVISNLTINSLSDYAGLFGMAVGGRLRNIGFVNVNVRGGKYVGALAGNTTGAENCYVANGNIYGTENVGGLIGLNQNAGILIGNVEDCYSRANVDGTLYIGGLIGNNVSGVKRCHATGAVTADDNAGGLIGRLTCGSVYECYATGNVIRDSVYNASTLGGLIGLAGNSASVVNCHASGNVTGGGSVGGLIGVVDDSHVQNCYSIGTVKTNVINYPAGGLVGRNYDGNVLGCFWDKQSSGNTASSGGMGKATEEMKTLSTFTSAGWDFVDTWTICEGTNYPRLQWQIPAGDFVCPDGVGVEDLSALSACWLETVQVKSDINDDNAVDFGDILKLSQNWLLSNCVACNGADITGDGDVDELDLSLMTEQWMMIENAGCRMMDLNADGGVDLADWAVFAGNWMEGE